MGAMALLRQFFTMQNGIKRWSKKHQILPYSPMILLPAIFEAKQIRCSPRSKLEKSLNSFYHYRKRKRIRTFKSLKALNARLLVPVNFPKPMM